jgi:hypothetical protein
MSMPAITLDRAADPSSRPVEASEDRPLRKTIAKLLARLKPAPGAAENRHEVYLGL